MAASAGRAPRCSSKPDDLAYILFTSGTTSAPKGVMVTHENLFTHLETISRVFGYNSNSRIFNGMVLAHGDGLVQGPLLTLANGCRMVRPEPFSTQTIETFLNMVRARRATHFLTVPAVYALIDRYAEHDDYFAADEFVAMISVAAKLEVKLWNSLEAKFRRPVSNMYGLTETVTGGLYAGPYPGMGPVGTIGKPIDIDVRLVRADGTDAPDGEPGEIWLRGSCVSPGYYKAPAETAERYSGQWLKTADVAVKRPDGAYEMVGRLKTIIMYGGFLIRPEEIDEVLLRHPAVVEAATVGLEDADFGEIPVSAVVLDSAADENELTAHCLSHLESKKVPRRIIALPSIPRGDAGKTQINALRELLASRHGHAAAAGDGGRTDIEAAVIDAAAATFRMPRAELSLDSTPETVAMWDSFAHIALMHNVEARLGIQLPTAEVVTIDSLRKLVDAVRRQQ